MRNTNFFPAWFFGLLGSCCVWLAWGLPFFVYLDQFQHFQNNMLGIAGAVIGFTAQAIYTR